MKDLAAMDDVQYDYIVVGGGAAGCVLANRLSADSRLRVALVEAGPSDRGFPANIKTAMPAGNIFLLPHAKYNWQYTFAAHDAVAGRELPCPRGRLLGGSSSVNASVYMRGHPSDYDDWASLGNPGWRYEDVLPYFKSHQHYPEGDAAWHGHGGELQVGVPELVNPMARAFVDAAVAAGFSRNPDPNGAVQEGFGICPVTQRGGVRSSSSRAFLHPVMGRPNLQVFTGCFVERVLIQGRRAIGVVVVRDGRRWIMRSAAEVVLAAGTVNSPKLLMLSGIGPAEHLMAHGIAVVHDLLGVGENLQDHASFGINSEDPSGESYALTLRRFHRAMAAPLRYLLNRSGMLASNAAEAFGYLRSRPELDRPDLQLCFLVGLKGSTRLLPTRHGSVLMVNLLRPMARGRVSLRGSDSHLAPIIQPNFLSHSEDVQTLVRGFHVARRILATEPFFPYRGEEISPGAKVCSEYEIIDAMRRQVGSTHHCVGSCKMGPASDPMAVVDPELRVHGIDGLRVADASIMPTIVGGNTNAPAMMIGERAAVFLKMR